MGSTPVYGLPYPDLSDPANVPADIKALAEATEPALANKLDASIPGPLAAGRVVSAANGTATVTFPPGLFTAIPVVVATGVSATITVVVQVSAVTATGVSFTVTNGDIGGGAAAAVNWLAVGV